MMNIGPVNSGPTSKRRVRAGVHLGFFSGNEMYWKTRWENSIAGTSTAYRTLVCYKETWDNAKIDPSRGVDWHLA